MFSKAVLSPPSKQILHDIYDGILNLYTAMEILLGERQDSTSFELNSHYLVSLCIGFPWESRVAPLRLHGFN